MWLLDKPFERHLKSLAKNQRNIAEALSIMIPMEGNELQILEEEAGNISEGTKIITALYNNIEQKKKDAEIGNKHNIGVSIKISEEMRKILEEEQLLRLIINLNTDIYQDTKNQMDLLRQTHEISIALRNSYNNMIQYNQTIGNQASLLAVHHILDDIKNFSTRKIGALDDIDRLRVDKERKKEIIIAKCKQMKMDDEDIKKIAGQIMVDDRKDKKITDNMASMQMQFAH